MKHRVYALLLGTALSLAACGLSHAKSELIALSTTPVWPIFSTADSNIVYTVSSVGRGGAGVLDVVLTAGGMPPGVTATFSPSVLRFTGNALTLQTATLTIACQSLIPLDSFPFTITGTSKNETITITNLVMFTPQYVATRPATLYIDDLGSGALRLRGLGATGKTYEIQATSDLANPAWTSLGNSSADGNGRFTFFTSQVLNAPARFYRTRELAP